MKKRSFRSTFVSVILVITVAIFIVNLVVYGINIKEIRQAEVLKMKTAGERIDDMITISLFVIRITMLEIFCWKIMKKMISV